MTTTSLCLCSCPPSPLSYPHSRPSSCYQLLLYLSPYRCPSSPPPDINITNYLLQWILTIVSKSKLTRNRRRLVTTPSVRWWNEVLVCKMNLLTLWPWPLNSKTVPLLGYPKVIPYIKFEQFGIIRFWVMLRTDKQTNKQTALNILPTPTDVGNKTDGHNIKWTSLDNATELAVGWIHPWVGLGPAVHNMSNFPGSNH